jgi:hypothetical protein
MAAWRASYAAHATASSMLPENAAVHCRVLLCSSLVDFVRLNRSTVQHLIRKALLQVSCRSTE